MIGRVNASGGKKSPYPSAKDIIISYTGIMAEPRDIYDAEGNKYKLLELQTSGVLTFDKKVVLDLCVVNGGYPGYNSYQPTAGGAGGKMYNIFSVGIKTMTVTVAAAAGASTVKIDEFSSTTFATGAGTGGLIADNNSLKSGDGLSKYVFEDNSVYDYPICASGAGGTDTGWSSTGKLYEGASNGGTPVLVTKSTMGIGGNYGGGNGGQYSPRVEAENATTYGSGGGSGWAYHVYNESLQRGSNGSGMQGVIFARIRY